MSFDLTLAHKLLPTGRWRRRRPRQSRRSIIRLPFKWRFQLLPHTILFFCLILKEQTAETLMQGGSRIQSLQAKKAARRSRKLVSF